MGSVVVASERSIAGAAVVVVDDAVTGARVVDDPALASSSPSSLEQAPKTNSAATSTPPILNAPRGRMGAVFQEANSLRAQAGLAADGNCQFVRAEARRYDRAVASSGGERRG